MSSLRLERVERLLQEEIGSLILSQDIKDPRVNEMVVVNAVKVSKDLQYAKVWVAGYLSGRQLNRSVQGLNSAAGFIQSRIAKKLKFRVTPKLTFTVDTSLEQGYRVNAALDDLST
jgi:ribosome-binding factor A